VAKVIRAFSRIAVFSVSRSCSSVVLVEAQALADMCRKQIARGRDSRISPDEMAFRLECIGAACATAGDFAGALNVLGLVLDLIGSGGFDPGSRSKSPMLFHAITLAAHMWCEETYPRSAIYPFIDRIKAERRAVKSALSYGEALNPVTHLQVVRFVRDVGLE